MLPAMRAFSSSSSPLLRRAFSSTPSAHLARITIVGRLAADPEVTVTSTGKEIVKYAVGSSSGPMENRKTSWFRVSSFDEGPRRDYVMGMKKGTMVYVDGDARLDKYTADGRTQQALNITQRKKTRPLSTNPLTPPGTITVLARPRDQEEESVDETQTEY